MAFAVATTLSSTGNFSTSRYSEVIKAGILDFEPNTHLFRSLCVIGKGVKGHSNQIRINRDRRLPIPNSGATEGVTPTAEPLQIDSATGTATQYVFVVSFTDVAEIYAFHDLLKQAMTAVKDVMERLDDKICSDPFMACTNIVYAGSATARSGLTTADVISTSQIKKMVGISRRGSNIYGPAPKTSGMLLGLMNNYTEMDAQADPTFEQAVTRAQKLGLYEKGVFAENWCGVRWYVTNWSPELKTNLTEAAAASATEFAVTSTNSTGTISNGGTDSFAVKVVRKHKLRGFSEEMSAVYLEVMTAGDDTIPVDLPTDTDYWYDVYAGTATVEDDANYTVRLVAENQAGATTVTILAEASGSAALAPVSPASGVRVAPFWVLGKGAVSTIDLKSLETFVVARKAEKADPAAQNNYVSAKVFEGAFLQQNEWIRRGEAHTTNID